MYLLMLLVVAGAVITEAATDVKCPPGTVKTKGGFCEVIARRAAFSKDISDEPYCPKGKFYLKGDCVGRGRRTADDPDCPQGAVKSDYGCIDIRRRAYDASKFQDGSDEPYCPTGTFYQDGLCVARPKRSPDDCPAGTVNINGECVPDSGDTVDEPDCPVNLKKGDGGCGPN